MPSLRETTGTAVFEAMANKLPIIALNQNGVKDIVQNDCGILVNVCSKEQVIVDLATALNLLPGLIASLALCRGSYKFVSEINGGLVPANVNIGTTFFQS